MPRLVMKFGGTSVADLDRIRNAAEKVKREVDRGYDVAVVVSAMSGKTNELVGWVRSISPLYDAREYDAVVASGENVTAGLMAMECIVVQDLFLNETAKYAHVFLPGSSFLEKDGTFTNAERRISLVRKVMPPKAGLSDWEVTMKLSNALGYPMNYKHPREIMDEIAKLTPTFHGVSFEKIAPKSTCPSPRLRNRPARSTHDW
mgnify:CR=1 FL=1